MTNAAETQSKTKREEKTNWLAEVRNLFVLLLIVLGIHSFIAKPFYIPSASMMPVLITGDRLLVTKYPYGWSYSSISFHLAPPFKGRLFGRTPDRGDIVIVEPNGVRTDYIKRVIGLPGDVIAVTGGRLSINGKPVPSQVMPMRVMPLDLNLNEDECTQSGRIITMGDGKPGCELQIVRETLPNGAAYDTIDRGVSEGDEFGPYRVPAGHAFLMGDNRDDSSDSRFPVGRLGLGGAVPFENIGGRAEFITFSLDGTAQWYNPISWFTSMRGGRADTSLRPDHVAAPSTR